MNYDYEKLREDLSEYFDDIKKFSNECKYSDCLHTEDDEDCNVIKNLDKISISRYESYISFLKEAEEYRQKVIFESQKEEGFYKNHMNKSFVKISNKKRNFSRKKVKQETKNLHFEEREEDD